MAIDLGAGSGRVVLGTIGDSAGPALTELHRFPNLPRRGAGPERWDLGALWAGVLEGLLAAARSGHEIRSIGVDGWGVDYGLLDANGTLLEDPICYRDPRTQGVPEKVFAIVPRKELFARTGLQVQPFNTLFQLFAHVHGGHFPERAERLLFVPDLIHALLCESASTELTIASTSQMLHVATRDWDTELLRRLGLPAGILPRIEPPGSGLGVLTRAVQKSTGLGPVPVVTPAAHDTASAVVGAGQTRAAPDEAFLSSGTWSLLGVVTAKPVVNDAVARHNLTNEAGAFGTNRLLANVMGLWIVEECRRVWEARGFTVDWERLLATVARAPAHAARIAVDDPRFFHPVDMVAELQAHLAETGQQVEEGAAPLIRVVLESLALRYAEVVRALESATGTRVRRITIVGGGVRNALLNQWTADATGLEVRAGPEEATALGNLLVQASHFGALPVSTDALPCYVPREARP